MRADERRRHELTRLASEILADATVLDQVAQNCAAARPSLQSQPDRAVLALVAVELHRYYTAVENVLERIERVVGALPPAGPSWHKDLLWGALRELADARPAILSAAVAPDLDAMLSFRRFFRHAYAVEFDPVRLDGLCGRMARIHAQVGTDLRRFARTCSGSPPGCRAEAGPRPTPTCSGGTAQTATGRQGPQLAPALTVTMRPGCRCRSATSRTCSGVTARISSG